MARPAVASSLIPRLGLSTPSPNPFALTSTPCCCKTAQAVVSLSSAEAEFYEAVKAAAARTGCVSKMRDLGVVDADFRRCFP